MAKGTLAKASDVEAKEFIGLVKKQYIEKYAQDVVVMLEDQKKLKRAYDKVTAAIKEVEAGNYDAIEKYKRSRAKLEAEDNYDFS